MNNQKFKNHIYKILKSDKRLWYPEKHEDGNETTELNQIKLIHLAEKYDETILNLLFNDKQCKEKFFVKIADNYVFKNRDFQFFLEENKIDNSYTQYKNCIGLSDGRRFLKDNKEVVLNFPFKDCILEGGQSTEEGTDTSYKTNKDEQLEECKTKRKEIFFNEILAADEIDRLRDEKALVNWKRFYADDKNVGTEQCSVPTEIKRDTNGTIKENLIIKGNNLLALHSLKKQFAKKVKLIYIDPPYNTGGDANIFTYNNNFNHSTWLTFMKNRLEVARELLRDDGFIAIAIDHCELFYLGTLADEIFGRENRLGIVTVVHKPEGRQTTNFFNPTTEYMLIYAKNKTITSFNNVAIDKNIKKTFDRNDNDGKGNYKLKEYLNNDMMDRVSRKNKPKFWYPIYVSSDLKIITLEKKNDYYEILPITKNKQEKTWQTTKQTTAQRIKNSEIVAEYDQNNEIIIYYKFIEQQRFKTHWEDKKYNATANGTNLLSKILGRTNTFSYPKSLYTVLDTLKIMTNKDDIILDFHAGSGTTGHAVLALNKEDGGNRKFILVEQLDKHVEICNERIQKVLAQENINNSFIYCELAKWNEQAKEHILACESLEELEKFFSEMVEKYFLNYNLKIKEFQEKVLQEEEFKKLSLTKQKEMFCAMLDNNQMYVCRSEMEDGKFGIGERDIEMSKEFYKS